MTRHMLRPRHSDYYASLEIHGFEPERTHPEWERHEAAFFAAGDALAELPDVLPAERFDDLG